MEMDISFFSNSSFSYNSGKGIASSLMLKFLHIFVSIMDALKNMFR